jgi:3-oxoacyl-[acyl-carrier protein] reductase
MSEQPGVALVSGGARGIGRAIVREFHRGGMKVAFTYLGREEAAKSLLEELSDADGRCAAYQADVRDFTRCEEVVQDVREKLGPLDILVNNAGVKRDEPLYRMAPETWREVVDTNLNGTFNFSRVVILEMIKRQSGCIINIVSVSGILGLPGQTNYAASKAGVIGFTKALSREVARFNIRVNAVAPGFIHTDMLEEIPEALRKKLFSQIPSGSPGTAEQVAKVVRFLAGEDASYVTGQVLPVDGGMV